jgi:hypothetical protein
MNNIESLTLSKIEKLVIKFAYIQRIGMVVVLSEDMDGMTFVGRWVHTDLIEDVNLKEHLDD